MSSKFGFKVDPSIRELLKRVSGAKSKAQNTGPLMAKISVYLDQWNKVNFSTEGGKVGGWEKLALGGRRVKGGGVDTSAQILRDTGTLQLSFLPWSTKDEAGIGSKLPYSLYHNEGKGHLPQRRMVPLEQEVIEDIKKIATAHIKR